MAIELSACELDELRNRRRIQDEIERTAPSTDKTKGKELAVVASHKVDPDEIRLIARKFSTVRVQPSQCSPPAATRVIRSVTGIGKRGRPPGASLLASRYYNPSRNGYKKQCPKCGRNITLVDGKIINHRSGVDAAGRANGDWCEYTEIVI
jgi:hypothetical protein